MHHQIQRAWVIRMKPEQPIAVVHYPVVACNGINCTCGPGKTIRNGLSVDKLSRPVSPCLSAISNKLAAIFYNNATKTKMYVRILTFKPCSAKCLTKVQPIDLKNAALVCWIIQSKI